MVTNGEKLKETRLKQGKSIAELAQQTRISAQFLEAIESNRMDSIPGDFFRRSFVKQYAEALGLNPEEFQPETPLEFRSLGGSQGGDPFGGRMHEQPDLPPLPLAAGQRSISLRQIFLSTGLLIGVLAVCAVAYTIWEDYSAGRGGEETLAQSTDPPPVAIRETPPEPATPAPGGAEAAPAGALTGEPSTPSSQQAVPEVKPAAPDATTSAAASPQPTEAKPAPSETPSMVHGIGNRELRLSASASTWVQAREGDRTVFVGVINPGQTRILRLTEGARLLVGNAGGLHVVWQGEDAGVVGPLGQVRIVTVSPEGVSVAAPVKNPPAENSSASSRESR